MAFALVGIGLLLFVVAYHNNVAAFGSQLSADLGGSSGFMIWVVALFIIGAIGYIPAMKGVSRVFLVLILVVVFLSNKGVFAQLTEALGVASSSAKDDGMPKMPEEPEAPNEPKEPGAKT